MQHQYLIPYEKRELIKNFLMALESLYGKRAIKVEMLIRLTTEDERLALVLDPLLIPPVEGKAPEVKAPEEPEIQTEIKSSETTEKVKLDKRICELCKTEFQPHRRDQTRCSVCSKKPRNKKSQNGAKSHGSMISNSKKPVWRVMATSECISHNELTNRLKEHTLSVGAQLDHENNGAYIVVEHGEQLRIEKVLE